MFKKRLINFLDIDFGIRMANYFAYGAAATSEEFIFWQCIAYMNKIKIKEGVFPSFAIYYLKKKRTHNFK